MDEDWLSTSECGALMGVHRRTVDRWVEAGRLPAKIEWHGKHKVYRVRRADLIAFARSWIREEWR